jgi:hypothetical protein
MERQQKPTSMLDIELWCTSPSQESSKKIQLESEETYPSNIACSDKEI